MDTISYDLTLVRVYGWPDRHVGPETLVAKFWFKNDATWLYLLVRVAWSAGETDVNDGAFNGLFWGQYLPPWEHSDFSFVTFGHLTWDAYGWDETRWYTDTEASPHGQNNIEGAASYDGVYYWFEFRKALDSGDGYDWSLTPGQTVGSPRAPAESPHLIVGIWDSSISSTYEGYVSLKLSTRPAAPTDKTAIIVDPFSLEHPNPGLVSKITQYLQDAGYLSVATIHDGYVTIEWLKTGLRHGVVFWRGHGTEGHPWLVSGEEVSPETEEKYEDDFQQGRIFKSGTNGKVYWGILPAFINFYYGSNPLPYSLIYVEACYGLADDSMAGAFTSCGAGAYVSYESYINPDYWLWWWSGDENSRQAFEDFCHKGYSVEKVVNDIHAWYDPLCSLGWYGDKDIKLVSVTVSIRDFGLVVRSPASLYVTDPQGRHIGFDPSTRQAVNEIPDAVYAGTGTEGWTEAESQIIWIPDAPEGVYDIKLLGTATGTCTLSVGLTTTSEMVSQTYALEVIVGQVLTSTATMSDTEVTSTSPVRIPPTALQNKLSLVNHVKLELDWLSASVSATDIRPDVKEDLLDKLTSATIKIDQAISWINSGNERQANHMLRSAENIIGAFVNHVGGQNGKAIPRVDANDLVVVAEGIAGDIRTAKSISI